MTTQEYILAKKILRLDGAVENLLLVDRFQDLAPASDRRLYKCLTLTQLQKRFGFFVLLFVLLKGLVYVFAVFRIDDQHIFPLFWDGKDRGLGEINKGDLDLSFTSFRIKSPFTLKELPIKICLS
jgi:hypothetical protein